MSQVKFLSGLKSQLASKAGSNELVVGALYFCTDEKKIFKAVSAGEYVAVNEEVNYGALPAIGDAFVGKLYLDSSNMTLHVKDGDAWKQLSAPADALVPNDISEDLNAEDNKKLASKAAVKAAVDKVAGDLAAEIANRGTAETQLLADAKKYADDQDAALKADLQKEIDDDVKVEKDRAELAEQGLAGRLDKIEGEGEGSIKKAVADEKARAEAEEGRLADAIAEEEKERIAADTALEERINALAGDGEGSVADQVGAVQDALDEFKNNVVGAPAIEADPENGVEGQPATGLFKEIADEKAAREAKDAELAEAIADEVARAKAAEEDNADAIADEVSAREAKDDELQAAIDKLNGAADAEGSVAKAVKDAVDAEKLARETADGALQDAIDDINEALGLGEDATAGVGARLNTLESEMDIVEGRADVLEGRADDLEAAVEVLNGAADAEGSVAKAVKDAVDAEKSAREKADADLQAAIDAISGEDGSMADLEARVKDNEDAIDVINGEGEGSIKKAVADLVDGAPETLNTLKELAGALRDNADVLGAIETAFNNKLATLQADVDQNEADCDAAIAAEKERAEKEEAAIREEMEAEANRVNQKIADDIAAESALRVAEEQRIEKALEDAIAKEVEDRDAAIKVEADRAKAEEADIRADFAAADSALQDAIDDINELIGNVSGEEGKTVTERVEDVEDIIGSKDDPAGTDSIYGAIADEKTAREEKEADFEARIAANEAFVAAQPAIDQAQNDRIKALEDANAEGGAVAENIQAAQAAADAAQKDVDAIENRLDAENGLVDRLEANEAFVAAQPAVDEAQDERLNDLEAFVEGHSHEAMEADIKANKEWIAAHSHEDIESRLNDLEGLFEGENSVDAKIAAAQAAAEAKAVELDAALETSLKGYADDAEAAAEEEAARLDGILKTQLEGYADQAEADAKAHAETYTNDALTWGSF